MNARDRVAYLEKRIADLNARMPKHSVPAAMIIELEDLEDELDELKTEVERGAD
jgi:HAMP domain-containing protein